MHYMCRTIPVVQSQTKTSVHTESPQPPRLCLCYFLCTAIGAFDFLLRPPQGVIRAGLGHCHCKCLPARGMLTHINQEAMNEKPFCSLIRCCTSITQPPKCYLLGNLRCLNIYQECDWPSLFWQSQGPLCVGNGNGAHTGPQAWRPPSRRAGTPPPKKNPSFPMEGPAACNPRPSITLSLTSYWDSLSRCKPHMEP